MKIETHVHTSEGSPCAKVDAAGITEAYRRAGYDAIVITNHFDNELLKTFGKTDEEKISRYLLGYRKAKEAGKQFGIRVLLGIEIRLEPSAEDFLIYGVHEEFLYQNPGLCFLNQEEIYHLCHANGAVFYQAHPFREPCMPKHPEFLDGVEYNQRPDSGNNNEKLAEWAKAYPELKAVSGSDCHDSGQVGYGGIITPQDISSEGELAEVLRNGQIRLIINKTQII